jgi:hypothetical protein
MATNTSNRDHGKESQTMIRYRPKKMSFREYDKKMLSYRPGLNIGKKCWRIAMSGIGWCRNWMQMEYKFL